MDRPRYLGPLVWSFEDWLDETLRLQRNSFGEDPPGKTGRDLAEYLRWNVLAAEDELHELMKEVQWKPWAKDQGRVVNRDAAVGELVDVLHFVANLLVMFSVTGAELTARYVDKVQVNAARQASGYDAFKTKCPQCGRALEEAGTRTIKSGRGVLFVCNGCNCVIEEKEAFG